MSDFTDTVVTKETAATDRGFASRGVVEETIEENETVAKVEGGEDVFTDMRAERAMPQSVLDRLAEMEKDDEPEEVTTEETVETKPEGEAEKVEAETDDAPKEEAKTEEKPVATDEITAWKTKAESLEAANARLIEETEAAKKAPRARSKREELLEEAERDYLEDSIASVRKLIAAGLGLEDPQHQDVTAELAGLYGDLTAKELGVTPDEAFQAKRESARTRQLLAREKRERKAQGQTSAEAEEAAKATKAKADAATFIGNRLSTKNGDRSLADDHPHLMSLAELFDGMKPESKLVEEIERGFKTGRYDSSKQSDDQVIADAAKTIETHYQALVEKINKASPKPQQPSTAKPSGDKPPAAATSAKPDTRQEPGTRTLTAADASVAPATTPAKKPATSKNDQPPKFKSNKERQEWALRHLPK